MSRKHTTDCVQRAQPFDTTSERLSAALGGLQAQAVAASAMLAALISNAKTTAAEKRAQRTDLAIAQTSMAEVAPECRAIHQIAGVLGRSIPTLPLQAVIEVGLNLGLFVIPGVLPSHGEEAA